MHEVTARGAGLVLREARLRRRAPEPFELSVAKHAASVEVVVLTAGGALARDVRGRVRWRGASLAGGSAWGILSEGTAALTFASLAAPAPVEIEAWLEDGECFTHALELA